MGKHRVWHIALLCLAYVPLSPAAAPLEQWFEKAHSFYEESEYDSAVVWYRRILNSGTINSDVLYNLGNAYFRRGELGLAILSYEKARLRAPNDPDILANLRFANTQIVDKISPPQPSFAQFLLERFHTMFSLHTQLWIVWGFLLIVSCLIGAAFLFSGSIRPWLIYASIVLFVVSLPVSISAGIKIYRLETVRRGVIIENVVDAKNQPEGAKVLFTVHEGTRCRLGKKVEGWVFISLDNGVSGWVQANAIGVI